MKASITLVIATLARQVVCDPPGQTTDIRQPADCSDWYDNVYGKSCEYIRDVVFKVPPELFNEWNPSVGVDCSNWYTWMSYCVQTWSRWSSMKSRYEATASMSTTASAPATTTTTTSSLAPSPTAWEEAGCFVEHTDEPYILQQNLTPAAGGDAHLSISKCKNSCSRRSYPFAGVKEGNQCWCGTHVLGTFSRNETRDCNVPCSGDSTAICGGNGFINIFRAEYEDGVVLEPQPLPQITSSTSTSTLGNVGTSTSTSTSNFSTATQSSGGVSARRWK